MVTLALVTDVQIMVVSTVAFLGAGRFGLAPTANRQASPSLKLQTTGRAGEFTGDPAGTHRSLH